MERDRGILFPYSLFPAFRDLLGFRKGALLLPRGSQRTFMPACALGFDQTSLARLRFDAHELADLSTPKVCKIKEDCATGLKFSQSDLEECENLLILPCRHQGTLEALFLLARSPYEAIEPETLGALLAGIAVSVGQAMAQERACLGSEQKVRLYTTKDTEALPHLALGAMARELAETFLGALPQALEQDLLAQSTRLLQAYQVEYCRSSHRLYLRSLPADERDQRVLMDRLLNTLQRQWSATRSDQHPITTFFTHASPHPA